MRWMFLLHRYLGVAGAAFMALWCVSGLVMMFVPYPSLPETARVAGLRSLEWRNCCHLSDYQASIPVSALSVEMLLNEPIVRFGTVDGHQDWAFLSRLAPERRISHAEARQIAQGFAERSGIAGRAARVETIDHDQWTVSGDFRSSRPLHRVGFDDPERTEIYVSGADGRVVQLTNERQRFWNWLGAVPHWLYFSALRHHAALWSQVVIWTALIGCFLTITGLWIGVCQFRARSRYRGIMFWHHIPGLVFGVFALAWVFSGLLSMNPWGLLESSGAGRKEAASVPMGTVLSVMEKLRLDTNPAVTVTWAPFAGGHHLVVTRLNGRRERLDAWGKISPLSDRDFQRAAALLGGTKAEKISTGDAYYYSRPSRSVSFPVYRIVGPPPARTRHYLDAVSGQAVASLDSAARGYRWLFTGLHTLDFTAVLRGNPLWQAFVMFLLIGVTALSGTGLYLGVQRLISDFRRLKTRLTISDH